MIPILSMLLCLGLIALEYPAPFMKGMSIHRSLPLRIVLLFFQAFMAVLWYQVRLALPIISSDNLTCGRFQGTNGALYSLIAAACYARAVTLGEEMKEAKDNRGGRGGAKA